MSFNLIMLMIQLHFMDLTVALRFIVCHGLVVTRWSPGGHQRTMSACSKLTKKLIDQTAPSQKRCFIWDAELRGFGARLDPSGTTTFIVRYRPKGTGRVGEKRFVTIGRYGVLTPEQARQQAKAILGAVAVGADPVADAKAEKQNRPLTFSEAVDLFLTEHAGAKRKPSTERHYRSLMQTYVLPSLHKRPVTEVTRAELAKLHFQMREKPMQANRLLSTLSSLYSFLGRRGLVPDEFNPARKIERYREGRRERFLSMDELERLGTAIRQGESIGFQWHVDDTKPLSKHLAKIEN